jgi:hypothetical protein
VTLELYNLSQPAVGVKIDFTGPSGYSFAGNARGSIISAGGFDQNLAHQVVSGTGLSFGGIASNNMPISVQGLLTTAGTAGTFRLQWAQTSSNAAGSTLKAGSYMLLQRVS